MNCFKYSAGIGALAACLALSATSAFAHDADRPQEQAPADAPSPASGMQQATPTPPAAPASQSEPIQGQEIVVTAEKRSQNLQDVPLALSVVSPAQLQAAGARQFEDLGKVVPALTVRTANQPQNADISIRGVGTFAFGIGVEPSVAVLIDGVPLSVEARAFNDLPDVERIEVLRGPQSTLYGKSASAGLINIITRDPTDQFHLRASALATTDDEYKIDGSVSGPITDNLAYILSGSYTHYRGNVRNTVLDRRVGGRENVNLRGKLRWDPLDNLKFTLSGNYTNGHTTIGAVYVDLDPSARFIGVPSFTPQVVFPGVTASRHNQKNAENFLTRTRYHGGGGYLRGELGLGSGLSLVSITSLDIYRLHDYTDQDTGAAPGVYGMNTEIGTFRTHLFTQEVRLVSPTEKPFHYIVGAYYAKNSFERPFMRGPAFLLASWFATFDSRQIAGFGQADWEILPSLTLTGGGRIQNEKVSYTYLNRRNDDFFSGGSSDTAGTYKLSARYAFTRDISAFATYATGYKGQTYDLTTGFDAARAAQGPIKPETSHDKEIGIRSQFLDRRLTLNLTFFDTHFDNLQAQTIESVGASQTYRLTNVGGLTTKGIELETSARVGEDLNLSGSAAYLDAEYSDYPAAACYDGQTAAEGCVGTPGRQNLTGKRARQAPSWKFTINGDYSPRLTDKLRGILRGSWQYQSRINYTATDPQTVQPAFSIVNLGIGVRSEDRRWEVVASVNNLFDVQYFPALLNNNAFFDDARATVGFLPRDFRRYGSLRVSLNF